LPLVLFGIVVAAASALGHSLAGGGLWLVLVGALRDVWVPNLVSLFYRRRWSRAFLWPFSVVEESECIRTLKSFSWAYVIIGAFLVIVASRS
jgi:hypothetical protein